jgi:hypothetical protein
MAGDRAEVDMILSASKQVDDVANAFLDRKEKQDTVAAEDAYNKLQLKQDRLLNDPDNGLLNKRGANAVGKKFYTDAMTSFNTEADGISSALNGRQQELFQQRRDIAESRFSHQTMVHQAAQTRQFNDQTDSATIETEIGNIAGSPHDAMQFQMSMDRALKAISNGGDRNGLPKEAVKELKDGFIEDAWTGRILGLVDSDPEAAKGYYKKGKKFMTADNRAKIERVINSSSNTKASQELADKIFSTDKTQSQKEAEARKAPSEIRDSVLSRVKVQGDRERKLEKQAQSEAADYGYSLAANNMEIPDTAFAAMDGKTEMVLRKLSEKGPPDTDNLEIYQAIKKLGPNEFRDADLLQFSRDLKESTLKSLMDKQVAVKNNDNSIIGDMTRVSASIESLGIIKSNKGAMYAKVDTWTESLGRKPTGDELQKFLDGLQREVITDKGLWNTTEKVGKIKAEGVPDAMIPAIVSYLEQQGKTEITDELIFSTYSEAAKYNSRNK